MISRKSPSLIRLIDTDYITLIAVVLPLVAWGLYAVLSIAQVKPAPGVTYIAIAAVITLIAILVFLWRYRTLARVFADGEAR
jgi:hypothetical protein